MDDFFKKQGHESCDGKFFGIDFADGPDKTVCTWVPCNHTLQSDCPYCRITALEAENALLKHNARAEERGTLRLRAKYGARDDETFPMFVKRLYRTIKRVEALPIKWISETGGTGVTPKDGDAKVFCAYELKEALENQND